MIRKLRTLTDLGSGIVSADLFHVVDDPTGTPINKKISVDQNVFNYIPTFIATNSTESLTNSSSAASVSTAVTLVDSSGGATSLSLVQLVLLGIKLKHLFAQLRVTTLLLLH